MIGHRGAAALAPENTWESFDVALNLGVDAIETDVRATSDGELVLLHDERLDRTTDEQGLIVHQSPWSFVKTLDVGSWFSTDPNIYSFDMSKPESQLVQEAVDTASKIFPAIKGRFVAHRIFRWEDNVPTFRPGYLDALAAFWSDPQEGPIFFCGHYFAGPSAGGALYTGRECAGRVLASL